MICVSIAEQNFDKCKSIVRECSLAEIRLDKCKFSFEQIRDLFSSATARLVATYRQEGVGEEERKSALVAAIKSGAAFVDIDTVNDHEFIRNIVDAAKAYETRLIISYHNFQRTPDIHELQTLVERCFAQGAEIAKIACQANTAADSARLLSLYDTDLARKGKLLILGMGKPGQITRLAAPLLGAPFMYASLETGSETAPGQFDVTSLRKLLDYFAK